MPGFEEEDDGGSLLFILQTPMTTAERYVELEDKQAANETLVQARERDNTSKALLLLPSTSSSPINELKGGSVEAAFDWNGWLRCSDEEEGNL